MRKGVRAMLFICIFVISILAVSFVLMRQQGKVISPLADDSNVLGEEATPSPTLTPAPTLTPPPTGGPTRKSPPGQRPSGPATTPKPTRTPTPTPKPTPIIVTSAELEALFTKYSNEYSVDKELLKRIAQCESGMNPGASNRGYGGLYQFTETLWIQTRQLTGQNPDVNLRFNPEEAIRTAAFMLSQGHLYIWPNCNK